MNVYSNEKITVSEERYNELIRAEFALRIVREKLRKKIVPGGSWDGLSFVTFDKSEIETLLLMTGKGEGEA